MNLGLHQVDCSKCADQQWRTALFDPADPAHVCVHSPSRPLHVRPRYHVTCRAVRVGGDMLQLFELVESEWNH